MLHMMPYTRPRPQLWLRWYFSVVLCLSLSSWTQALDISYCSPDNNGGGNSLQDNFMSNGKCQDNCGGYVFAVISGKDCWCSNYVPGDQVSSSECSTPCPGYPYENCASSGLYAYFNLGGSPSGTSGGSSSSAASTSSPSTSAQSSSSTRRVSSNSITSSSSTASDAPTVLTSVFTVTGKASTILVTPTAAQTSDSALGANSPINEGGKSSLSGGAVAGIVVGVAIVIGLIIGAVVFFWLRRRHRRNLEAVSEGGSFTSSSRPGKNNAGIPSRQVSQMSSAGLLNKPTRANTGGISSAGGSNNGNGTINSDRNSTHMTVDQRLNPWAIYSNEDSRASNVSLQDNHDYSRQLRVANPDPS